MYELIPYILTQKSDENVKINKTLNKPIKRNLTKPHSIFNEQY